MRTRIKYSNVAALAAVAVMESALQVSGAITNLTGLTTGSTPDPEVPKAGITVTGPSSAGAVPQNLVDGLTGTGGASLAGVWYNAGADGSDQTLSFDLGGSFDITAVKVDFGWDARDDMTYTFHANGVDQGSFAVDDGGTDSAAYPGEPATTFLFDSGFIATNITLNLTDVGAGNPPAPEEDDPVIAEVTFYYGAASDTNAPNWTAGYPQVTPETPISATARASIDEYGTAWFVVVSNGVTAPTPAEVTNGANYGSVTLIASGSIALTPGSTNTAAITGLSTETAYDVYFAAGDLKSPPNLQANAAKVGIVTGAGEIIMVVDGDDGSWTTYDRSSGTENTAGLTGTFTNGGLEWGGGMANAWNGSSPGFCTAGTADTATWTVSGYTPGTLVRVYVHWQHQGNAAPAAPYSVNGGATVYKDHQAGPPAADIALTDPLLVDQPFELIGEYAADGGGQVQVVLSAAASGFANADAMAFVSVPPPPFGTVLVVR